MEKQCTASQNPYPWPQKEETDNYIRKRHGRSIIRRAFLPQRAPGASTYLNARNWQRKTSDAREIAIMRERGRNDESRREMKKDVLPNARDSNKCAFKRARATATAPKCSQVQRSMHRVAQGLKRAWIIRVRKTVRSARQLSGIIIIGLRAPFYLLAELPRAPRQISRAYFLWRPNLGLRRILLLTVTSPLLFRLCSAVGIHLWNLLRGLAAMEDLQLKRENSIEIFFYIMLLEYLYECLWRFCMV